jgi:hypothetical protein
VKEYLSACIRRERPNGRDRYAVLFYLAFLDSSVELSTGLPLYLVSANGSAAAISECAVRHPRATTTH